MNKAFYLLIAFLLISCQQSIDKTVARNEVYMAEEEFEKMATEKGMAEAFYYFADDSATILRGNDSLITGKENIRHYYTVRSNPDAKLNWTPDYIYVSDCGTLAYTYGKYIYSITNASGDVKENKGIFHTVWKKRNNEWKYVWD
jgi:ketosteroid isomerase-like protein